MVPLASMTNILSDDKRQEVLALGRLGWTLRRIEQTTGVRHGLLWHRLLGGQRPIMAHYVKGGGGHSWGARRRRGLMLPSLSKLPRLPLPALAAGGAVKG